MWLAVKGPFRQQSVVATTDSDFIVRFASVDELLRVRRDAVTNRWRAHWSSEEALVQQVEPGTTSILCPLFRNGGAMDEPEAYRCYIWFALRSERHVHAVSLVDVSKELLSTLPAASDPDQLKQVIGTILEGSRGEAIR